MSVKTILPSLLLVAFLGVIAPSTALGYFTTDQRAVRLSDDLLLFSITYQLGSNRYGYHTPVLAERSERSGTRDRVEYQLIDGEGDAVTAGEARALVFADAPVTEGIQYEIEQGAGAELTLVALVDISEIADVPDELALSMTTLPFDLVTADAAYENGLNPSELQYYRTPLISTAEQSLQIKLQPASVPLK